MSENSFLSFLLAESQFRSHMRKFSIWQDGASGLKQACNPILAIEMEPDIWKIFWESRFFLIIKRWWKELCLAFSVFPPLNVCVALWQPHFNQETIKRTAETQPSDLSHYTAPRTYPWPANCYRDNKTPCKFNTYEQLIQVFAVVERINCIDKGKMGKLEADN